VQSSTKMNKSLGALGKNKGFCLRRGTGRVFGSQTYSLSSPVMVSSPCENSSSSRFMMWVVSSMKFH
jgi:hypothetical protein